MSNQKYEKNFKNQNLLEEYYVKIQELILIFMNTMKEKKEADKNG